MPTATRALTTMHDGIQNSSSLDSLTSPPTPSPPHWLTVHWHSHLLSALLVVLNVLLVVLLYFCFYKFFFRKPPSSSSRHPRDTIDTASTSDSSPPSSPRAGCALELQALNSLPVTEFKSDGTEMVECSVCLVEFKDGDKARVLPRCHHRFHVECVDTWFRSNANCPFCRTPMEEKTRTGSDSVV